MKQTLRQRAEALLGKQVRDVKSQAFELDVHRVELELQNEELRRLNAELAGERERLTELFEESPTAYMVLTENGRIKRANRAARELLGPDPAGSMLSGFVADGSVHAYALHLRAVRASRKRQSVRVDLAVGDVDVPVRIESVLTRSGETRMVAVDLRLENQLRRAEMQAAQLREVAGVIILTLGASGRVKRYNRFMSELAGVELADAVGSDWFDTFIPERLRAAARADFERYVRDPSITTTSTISVIETTDGERSIQWTGTPQAEGDEAVEAILFVGVDVTELVDSQRTLRAERERSRAILETAEDGIVTLDESGIIETFNPGAARLFGYPAIDAIGMDVAVLIPERHRELYREYISSRELEATSGGCELEGVREDGSLFPMHLSVSQMWIDGERRLCGFVRDLTESKQTEARLRQAQKLEAIGTLATGVAHDFNNLLMGVAGCADVALSKLDGASEARVFLEEIRRSAKSGASINKQLLAFTRSDPPETTVFDLNEAIAERETMLRRVLGEEIDISMDLRAGDGRIRADVGQIEQVLMNLTVNARDAIPKGPGGTVRIETEEASIGSKPAVVLRVVDSGEGMSDAVMARALDPFFSTKPADKGTGLGLSVVYGIVTQVGGQIRLASEAGRGTTVEVVLPSAAGRITQELPSVGLSSIAGASDLTVLVAEDDSTVRLAVRHYLEAGGARVLEASTGLEAMALIDGEPGPIDLLLTDMVLPGKTGTDIAARLVALQPEAKVLFMSAHSREWLVEHGRLDPLVKPLQKPFGQAELLERIEQALESPAPGSLGTLLIADDDLAVRSSLAAGLRGLGFAVLEASDGDEAVRLGSQHSREIDVLVVDAVLPQRMGVAVARDLDARIPGLVVVYISGYPRSIALQDDVVGARALFVEKPVSAEEIDLLIRGARISRTSIDTDHRVLLVEGGPGERLALAESLADVGFRVVCAGSGLEATALLDTETFDILLVAEALADTTGERLAAEVREVFPDVSVVYMSDRQGRGLDPSGLSLLKPIDPERLKAALIGLAAAGRSAR